MQLFNSLLSKFFAICLVSFMTLQLATSATLTTNYIVDKNESIIAKQPFDKKIYLNNEENHTGVYASLIYKPMILNIYPEGQLFPGASNSGVAIGYNYGNNRIEIEVCKINFKNIAIDDFSFNIDLPNVAVNFLYNFHIKNSSISPYIGWSLLALPLFPQLKYGASYKMNSKIDLLFGNTILFTSFNAEFALRYNF